MTHFRASGRRPRLLRSSPLVLAAVLALPLCVQAQERPRADSIGSPGRIVLPGGVTLGVGTQLQFTAVASEDPSEGEANGFRVDNARLRVYGTLPYGLAWALTTNHGELIEARVTRRLARGFDLDLGLLKPPQSGEYITSSRSIDFVSRARVVSALVRGRDVGLLVRWTGRPVELRAGILNGDGALREGGEDGVMGVLRADLLRTGEGGDSLRVGTSLVGNGDPERVTGEGLDRRYQAVERTAAVDVRVVRGPLLLSAEWMRGWTGTLEGEDPRGGHVTIGARLRSDTEILLRLDAFEAGGVGVPYSRQLVAGLSHRPTRELRFMANLFASLDGPDGGLRLLLRSQLYF